MRAFEPHNIPESYFKVLIETSTLEPDNLGLSLALSLTVTYSVLLQAWGMSHTLTVLLSEAGTIPVLSGCRSRD